MEALAILIETRRLLEGGWCQERTAQDNLGRETDVLNSGACSFCITGAICRACWNITGRESNSLYMEIRNKYIVGMDLVAWNDDPTRKKEEVLARVDQAIERSRNESSSAN